MQIEAKHLSRYGDLNTSFFMLTNGLDKISNEFNLLKKIYMEFYSRDELTKLIKSRSLNATKHAVEKSIYRLSQLGIIDDWTVENFFTGEFEVQFKVHTDEDVKNALLDNIKKYDREFNIDNSKNNAQHQFVLKLYQEGKITLIEKYFLILLTKKKSDLIRPLPLYLAHKLVDPLASCYLQFFHQSSK